MDKLSSAPEYKSFQKENHDAYLVAGFFILDLESGNNIHQVDYYIPSSNKIAAFTLDGPKIILQTLDAMNNNKPLPLDIKTKVDLDALAGILEDEMKNRSITEEIKKIIAIIQNIDGKRIWNISCILSGMGILKAHVEDDSRSVLKMEKSSILDYIKKIPSAELKKQMAEGKSPFKSDNPAMAPVSQGQKPTPALMKEEIKKLNKLEEAIEKEKTALNKEIKKEEKSSPKSIKKKSSKK